MGVFNVTKFAMQFVLLILQSLQLLVMGLDVLRIVAVLLQLLVLGDLVTSCKIFICESAYVIGLIRCILHDVPCGHLECLISVGELLDIRYSDFSRFSWT